MKTSVESLASRSSVYNCADDSAAEVLHYSDIPAQTMKIIRGFHTLNPTYNLMILFYYSLWAVSVIGIFFTQSLVIHCLAIYFIGCCISGLPIMTHEASHQLLSKNKKINRLLGFIGGLPGLISTTAYYSMHTAHHAQTRTENDPDDIENSRGPLMPLTLLYYVAFTIGVPAYIPRVAILGYRKASAGRRRDIVIEYSLILAVFATAFILVPFSVMLQIWILPLLVTTAITNVRGVAEHGLTTSGNVFTQTRTVLSNAYVRFMMCNLNYHLEHHLFPGVPWYHLPKIHALLRDEYERTGASVYPSYLSFLRDFFFVSIRGVRPNIRMIHASVADKVCG